MTNRVARTTKMTTTRGAVARRLAPVALALGLVLALPPGLGADSSGTIRFQRITSEDGLPQSAVHAVVQDGAGFIWIGTQEGLVRYDGYTFTAFEPDPADPTSLGSGWIWSLLEDRHGVLWIGTDGGGLHRLDAEREQFERVSLDRSDPEGGIHDRVRVIFEDHDGRLWVGTDAGLVTLGPTRDDPVRFVHEPTDPSSLGSDRVRSIAQDTQGHVWIGTDGGGVSRLDDELGRFRRYRHDPERPQSLSDDRIRKVYSAPDGTLWVGTYQGGLSRFTPEGDGFVHHRHDPQDPGSLGGDRIRDILQDNHGTLWVATDAGLSEWRPDRGAFVRHRHQPSEPASLSDNRVNVLYEDAGGVLWVGTHNGLNRFNLSAAAFALYRKPPGLASGLSHNVVTSFAEGADGTVWIGTYGGGLNRYDPATEVFTHYRHDPADRTSLADDRVMALHVDRAGLVWVGTFEGGLDRLDPVRETFRHYTHDPDDESSLSWNGVTSVLEDRSGALWVGTYRAGLNRLDPAQETFRRFRHDATDPTSLSSDGVLALHEDRSGVVWVGTEGGGLNRFDRGSESFTHFRQDPEDAESLSHDTAWSIHEDRQGGFWIGTQGGGLNYWSADARRSHQNRFRHYLREDGLPSAVIYGVSEDRQGRLWLSTHRGLARLEPTTGHVKAYTTKHGLQDLDFNFGAMLRSDDGRMYFGGSNGFNAFYPDEVVDNQHRPPVVITAVYVLDQRVPLPGPAHTLAELELTPEDDVVAFEFAALDYTDPSSNRHQYMLEGFDRDWVDAGASRRATYTNLDGGDYVFRVRGANNDGVWSETPVAVALTVLPPWWQTSWAFILYGLLIGSLGWWLELRHRNNLRAEADHARRLEREVEHRTRELAERNRQLADLNQQLEAASYTDSLTGLMNRRFLVNQIDKDVALVRRAYAETALPEAGEPPRDLLFLMLDVDGLKTINDTFGHAAGDRALVQVREILVRLCRKSDMIVRWGGDEFLLVCRETDRETAERLAERVRACISSHQFDLGGGRTGAMSCSIGFAMFPFIPSAPGALTWEQVVHIADRGLYAAKHAGKNRWVGIHAAAAVDPPTLRKRIDDDLHRLAREGILCLRQARGESWPEDVPCESASSAVA